MKNSLGFELQIDFICLIRILIILEVIFYKLRVEQFAIFDKLVFAITSRILRILMEHIEMKNSLDSKLQIDSICSIGILSTLVVIAETSFSKISKCSALDQGMR